MKSSPYHDVKWTPEDVARLWGYHSQRPNSNYFALAAGRKVIGRLNRSFNLRGKRILDYGCGPAYLFDHLTQSVKEFAYFGLDMSRDSIAVAVDRVGRDRRFLGVGDANEPNCIASEAFDVAIACEVIEHLDDKTLSQMMGSCRKALRPNGKLCITTPNSENLEDQKVACPECGCVFHKWQHVRSWSPSQLMKYIESEGFVIRECRETFFGSPMVHLGYLVLSRLDRGRKMPNLYLVAEKS